MLKSRRPYLNRKLSGMTKDQKLVDELNKAYEGGEGLKILQYDKHRFDVMWLSINEASVWILNHSYHRKRTHSLI